jgi:hypothetical protein
LLTKESFGEAALKRQLVTLTISLKRHLLGKPSQIIRFLNVASYKVELCLKDVFPEQPLKFLDLRAVHKMRLVVLRRLGI